MTRAVTHHYRDPIDEIWLATARKLGLNVRRSDAAYATYDGKGGLELSTGAHFDADDSLAQMILHELCHALVAGDLAFEHRDWGLCNTDARDLASEHACQRVQAALGDRHGVRGLLAVTTDHRPYWDALPDDPLAPGDDPAIELARAAWRRARSGTLGAALDAALRATASAAQAARVFAEAGSLWHTTQPLHASGFPLARDASRTCRDCTWLFSGARGRESTRCRQTQKGAAASARPVPADARGCERWEPKLSDQSCASCGACCHEGFDLVPVRARDAITKLHPELVRSDRHGLHLPRPNGRCVALDGDGKTNAFRCRVYADRPRSCSDFEISGAACLEARRRVGISR